MKTLKCSDCQKQLPLDKFSKNNSGKRGYYWYCKDCHRARRQSEYQKEKGTIAEKRRANKQRLADSMGGCCTRCGYGEFVDSLEFHHIDPAEKEGALNRLIRYDLDAAKKEAEKCILLCANCHSSLHGGRWVLEHDKRQYKYSTRARKVVG